MANIYKGFSTVNKIRAPYTLTDAELVKTDLLNELNTRQGERVMRPTFGTRIFDILMHMHEIKYVPRPEIMPNTKIRHQCPGTHAWPSRTCEYFMSITRNMLLTEVLVSKWTRFRVL